MHEIFTRNLHDPSAQSVRSLIFNKNDKRRDPLRFPLIPLKDEDMLMAGFVFSPCIHFYMDIGHCAEISRAYISRCWPFLDEKEISFKKGIIEEVY